MTHPVHQSTLTEPPILPPAEKLMEFCKKFIAEQQISSGETIYQCDWVIENACEFIEGVCEIVGYHKADD
jgi:hypothetical protein